MNVTAATGLVGVGLGHEGWHDAKLVACRLGDPFEELGVVGHPKDGLVGEC